MTTKKTLSSVTALAPASLLLSAFLLLPACSSDSSNNVDDDETDSDETDSDETGSTAVIDIKDKILTERSADCADHAAKYTASVLDITESTGFDSDVQITSDSDSCTFISDAIPNHDFNDSSAAFFGAVSEQNLEYSVTRSPAIASTTTALTQQTKNAILLNGVLVDILSAGCYAPDSPDADDTGNTAIGCGSDSAWLLDPLGTSHKFGADAHNAHVQPQGMYHYHGSPKAMFDDNPGPDGSPVIGFAADGFPVYGSYFYDKDSGAVRKAESGYSLKQGTRAAIDGLNPGGDYDGTYVADWEFGGTGDLDACNGMTVNGQYGYYAIDAYPWVIACFSGTPDESFGVVGADDSNRPPPPGQ